MVKKTVLALCLSLLCAACTSEIKRLKETEYLRTQPGKPVVYPEDVDRPAQEKTFVVPELSRPEQADPEPPELLVLPPRLAGVDLVEETEEDVDGRPEDKAGDDESTDEGFLETQ